MSQINKQAAEFKKLKLTQKLQSKQGSYELFEGQTASNERCYVLQSAKITEDCVQKLFGQQLSHLTLPTEIFKVDGMISIVFQNTGQYELIKPTAITSESVVWDIIGQVTFILNVLKQCNMHLKDLEQSLIYSDAQGSVQMFIYGDVEATTNPADAINDIQMLGSYVSQFTGFIKSNAIEEIIQALTVNPQLITVDELFQHPLVRTNEFRKSVASQKSFVLSDFKFEKELGTGAYGRCDLVTYIPSLEKVVLKSTTNSKAQDVEVGMLQACAHPNVVRFYGAFTDNRTHYIVMQFCDGGDLFDKLTQNSLPDSKKVFEWLAQLCSAIYFMHMQRLLHRDVKPQNVLIHQGNAMLADFGVSREVEEYAQTVVGTPLYFSPEQHFRQQYTLPADIFSLGLVFFNMCVGSHPFTSQPSDQQQFYNHIKKHGHANAYCNYVKDAQLKKLISSMLVFDPDKRATAEDLCKVPEIYAYLKVNGLPCPGLSLVLTNARLINQVGNLFQVLDQLDEKAKKLQQAFKTNETTLGKFRDLAYQVLPFALGSSLKQMLPEKERNLYFEYKCLMLGRQLQRTIANQKTIQIESIGQANVTVRCGQQFMQVATIINKFEPTEDIQVLLSPALYLSDNLTIKAKTVILACQNVIVEKPGVCLKIEAQQCIVGFQKHGGMPLKVELGTGRLFCDQPLLTKVQVNKQATVQDFAQIKSSSTEVSMLVSLLNHCFPQAFAGGKGFFVGTTEWE